MDVGLGASETLTTEPFFNWQFQQFDLKLAHQTDAFGFDFNLAALNDGLYMNTFAAQLQLGYYFMIKSGGLSFTGSPFDFRAGKLVHSDIVDSPYSLFISSHENPSLIADFTYNDGLFFYESRWIGLNYMSELGYQDRGAVYKAFGIHVGEFRFGYQDSTVFTQRVFDPAFFLIPMPGMIVQLIGISEGSPWQQSGNSNAIMGLFFDYSHASTDTGPIAGWYAYIQLLIDDINGNRFLHPEDSQNPDKIAWSLGGSVQTDFGVFGFYHAGATKYTFEPYGSTGLNTDYGYAYYPAASFINTAGGETPIPLEQNYIGYLHGENNLAFMTTYRAEWFGFATEASLEFGIRGSTSPANPWGVYSDWFEGGQGTHLLDDPLLEKSLTCSIAVDKDLGSWHFGTDLRLGYVWNELSLAQVPPEYLGTGNTIPYFVPSETNRFIASLSMSIGYTWHHPPDEP